MTKSMTSDAFGTLAEPTTLTIKCMLPGPIERVWSYVIESNSRCQWLASVELDMKAGSPIEF